MLVELVEVGVVLVGEVAEELLELAQALASAGAFAEPGFLADGADDIVPEDVVAVCGES